jgi:NAD+ synthase (glutamine-hydrolysing)
MRLGGATINQIPFDWKNNTDNIREAIRQAKEQKIRVLCMPELCLTGYGCEDVFLSDWLAAKAWDQLLQIVPEVDGITVSIGLPIKHNGFTYNGACVISNKKILGIALKQNLAKDGVHYEHRWFEEWPANEVTLLGEKYNHVQAGDLIFDVEGIKFGFEICEDAWRKTNRPGYRLCERGVDLILNPSASHFAMGKSVTREHEVVIEGSGKFNCVYIYTNLLGNEAGRMIYDGDIIIGQRGKLININRRLSLKKVNVISCDIDFDDPSKTKCTQLSDNKEKNEELVMATSLALYDYLRKSKAKGFTLSLSGGADSSLCAVLVAEMVKRVSGELGWKTFCESVGLDASKTQNDWKRAVGMLLTCAYQGTKNSSDQTLHAAKSLAESIGAEFHEWKIDDEVSSYSEKIETALGRKLNWETDDIAMQNIQARTRSPIIWMLANIKRAVLLTTSNRSEGDVGYATMDGDTSGSLAPIAGLSKVFILQWLKWAEKSLGHSGLNAVNNLQPTAELRPLERHQTDEADLMPYPILNEIEKHAIMDRKSPAEVFHAMKQNQDPIALKKYIRKFFTLWAANQWKRERLAPSFHLDDLNVDPRSWCRFPILSSGFYEELQTLDNL